MFAQNDGLESMPKTLALCFTNNNQKETLELGNTLLQIFLLQSEQNLVFKYTELWIYFMYSYFITLSLLFQAASL